ncbi:MAG: response regulator, partial [Muribaculaceae bacterium]|nr:response regulator [Muribaculaceae bacterium]
MKCIIVDDEPIARRGMKRLVDSRHELQLLASLDSAEAAEDFLAENDVDLIFLDIE